MPGEEDPPAAEPVGSLAERDSQQQERAHRTERQEREPALGQTQASLQQQVDEGVADRRQTQQERTEREPPQVRSAQQTERRAHGHRGCRHGRLGCGRLHRGTAGWGRRRDTSGSEKQQHQHAHGGDAEAHHEHGVESPGSRPQDEEGRERAQQRSRGVHGAVHAEGTALGTGRRGK